MTATQDFLLEIGCEEMPSAPLIHAQAQLGQLVEEGLTEVGLAHGSLRTLSTPRRLAVIVESVALATQEVHESLRGPAVAIAFDAEGNPTKAAYGFARKNGIDTDDLVRRAGDDGREYVFVEKNIPSKKALPILRDLCEQYIAALEWPNYRSQRWGSEHQPFVRPIRWICALLGTEVIPVQYADVESSHTTQGHRVLAPGRHVVSEPAVYEQVLESAFVLGEQRRRELILAGVQAIEAARDGAHVDTPRRVLDEVVNLCEWPRFLQARSMRHFSRFHVRSSVNLCSRINVIFPSMLPMVI
jgi:glycyl-tRNA synthetase beta chain